jgi:glucose/arabinose dehydrogenase
MRPTRRVIPSTMILTLVAGSALIVTPSSAHPAARPAPRRVATAAALKAVPVKTGLNGPAGFTFAADGNIWYLERGTGEIRILNRTTGRDHLFWKISNVNGDGERGALGIALHPKWPAQRFVYVYVTRTDHGRLVNELLRIHVENGKLNGWRPLFKWAVSSATNHNGGRILFAPRGRLFIVVGENANPANSQRTANLRGKILRINPDGSIPKDNPFGTRIWSFGHRNSFGFDFDPATGRLWETENGPDCNDEINLIHKGANYAWGPHQSCGSLRTPRDTNRDGPTPRILPKAWFVNTIGITGAAFCKGCDLGPGIAGDLVFGDVNTGSIRAIRLNAERTAFAAASRVVFHAATGVYSLETSPDGHIFFSGPTAILRLARG